MNPRSLLPCFYGLLLGVFAVSPALAQDTARSIRTQPPQQKVCDMRFKGIRIEVRDAAGKPVNDAHVEVRQESDGELVRVLTKALDEKGGYIVLDDNTPGAVTPGVAYVVTAHRGEGRPVRARMVAGAGPDGCHVALLKGPKVLVLK